MQHISIPITEKWDAPFFHSEWVSTLHSPSAAYQVWCDFSVLTHLLFSKCLFFYPFFLNSLRRPTFSLTFFMPRFFVSHRRRQTEADSCSLWGWENTKMKSSVCVRAFRSELLRCNKGVRSATETRRICRIQPGKLWMTFWLSVIEQRWLCIAFSILHWLQLQQRVKHANI